MKKTFGIIAMLVMTVCMMSACGSNITKNDLGIKLSEGSIRIGQPMEDIDLEMAGGRVLEAAIYCVENNDGVVMNIECREESAELISGVKIGDRMDKVLRTYGDNLMYDNYKDEAQYKLQYLYYEKDGRLVSTADKVQADYFQYMDKNKLSDDEIEYLDANLEEIAQSDIYGLEFFIQDGVVASYRISWSWKN